MGWASRPHKKCNLDVEQLIDFLVEFEPGKTPGYFKIVSMEMELSELLEGRKIDLRTPNELSVYFRDRVMAEAVVMFLEGASL